MKENKLRSWLLAVGVLTLVASACGSSKKAAISTTTTAAGGTTAAALCDASKAPATLTKVKLQLQWFIQAQFAGYYAALDQGCYKAEGLDVQIIEGGVDIVPQKVLADGQADFALAWVPKALASREAGADIVDIGQIFQRSGTLQVSFKDKNITTAAAYKGKKIGNWGFGNEWEVFAAATKAGLDTKKDFSMVQQQFDMKALLSGDIDAAEAMTYNEYAQVLEAKNPKTGQLYTPSDFNAVNYNNEGVGMLQDAVWADGKKIASDSTYQDTAVKFLRASMKGWVYCRDNGAKCADLVVAKGSKLGRTHQLWQMNEINKLIWPSPSGIGIVDQAAWDRTVQVAKTATNLEGKTAITKDPGKAFDNTFAQKAVDALKQANVDVNGNNFAPSTVTLTEGGV